MKASSLRTCVRSWCQASITREYIAYSSLAVLSPGRPATKAEGVRGGKLPPEYVEGLTEAAAAPVVRMQAGMKNELTRKL